MSSLDAEDDTLLPVKVRTRERVKKLAGDGKTYDRFINEMCDLWEIENK